MKALTTFVVAVVAAAAFIFGLIFAYAVVLGYPTMWLMNYLFAPSFLQMVFGISAITFWKAFWFYCFMGFVVRSSTGFSSKKKEEKITRGY